MHSSQRLRFRIGLSGAFVAPALLVAGTVAYFLVFRAFDMNALSMAGFVGILLAALFARNYGLFWDSVIAGIASKTSITIMLILLSVGLVSQLLQSTGVSEGFIWLASTLGVEGAMFIAVTFLAVCAISMSTGTSIGTIFTAYPIFYPVSAAVDADPVLLAGAILSGALFGDNLAPISDTSIIAASTHRYRRREGVAEVGGVVRARAKYALITAGICFFLYLIVGSLNESSIGGQTANGVADSVSPLGLVMLIPVVALLFVAFWKRDLFLAVTVGLIVGTIVALTSGLLTPAGIVSVKEGVPSGYLVEGLAGILPLVGLSVVVFGILGILQASGILDVVVIKLLRSGVAKSVVGAELTIAVGSTVVTALFGGVLAAAMLTFGPIADRIGARVGLHPYRRANVMDCFALGLGCIVPVLSAFLFMASLLTGGYDNIPELGPLTIFPAVFYPLVLTLTMLVAVFTGWGRTYEGEAGAELKRPLEETPAVQGPKYAAPTIAKTKDPR